MDISSKNPESFEQNSVKRLFGWDPNEVAWVGVAWGGRFLKSHKGVPPTHPTNEMRPTEPP